MSITKKVLKYTGYGVIGFAFAGIAANTFLKPASKKKAWRYEGFNLPDGTFIFERKHFVNKSKTLVIFVHGLCDHTENFLFLKDFFNRQKISLYMYDARGHGKSSGVRVCVKDILLYSKDLLYILKNRVQIDKFENVFLMGHSFGCSQILMLKFLKYKKTGFLGEESTKYYKNEKRELPEPENLSLNEKQGSSSEVAYESMMEEQRKFGLLHKFPNIKGAICLSPFFSVEGGQSQSTQNIELKMFFGKFLATATPYVPISPPLEPEKITSNPDFLNFINNFDKLRYKGWYTARMGLSLVTGLKKHLRDKYPHIHIPALFIHSQEDQITSYEVSKDGYGKISSKDKQFVVVSEMMHDLLHEKGSREIMHTCLEWLVERTGAKKNKAKKNKKRKAKKE